MQVGVIRKLDGRIDPWPWIPRRPWDTDPDESKVWTIAAIQDRLNDTKKTTEPVMRLNLTESEKKNTSLKLNCLDLLKKTLRSF